MGFRVSGTLAFNTKQRRDAALNRWNSEASNRGWTGTATAVGTSGVSFTFTHATATAEEMDAFAEDAYRFCHSNGLAEGSMSVEPT